MKKEWSADSKMVRAGLLTLLSLALLLAVMPVYAANGPIVGRQVGLPVTFTAQGWANFCNPNNTIIPGGMVYNRFPIAFSCFQFYGATRQNQLIVGNQRYFIRYIGKTSCLQRLCMLLGSGTTGIRPQPPMEACGRLLMSLECPYNYLTADGVFVGGGDLATQTIVLLMNVAYNDMRVMPRTRGVDLECYTYTQYPFKGKTVAEIFNIANRVLAGESVLRFGLQNCGQLVQILQNINSNYEFINYNTYIDRGFLIPNAPFNPLAQPHCPSVPMTCM